MKRTIKNFKQFVNESENWEDEFRQERRNLDDRYLDKRKERGNWELDSDVPPADGGWEFDRDGIPRHTSGRERWPAYTIYTDGYVKNYDGDLEYTFGEMDTEDIDRFLNWMDRLKPKGKIYHGEI